MPNPFDLTGGPFLSLYCLLLLAAVVVSIRIPRPEGSSMPYGVRTPDQLAYLAGGADRVAEAAVTRLLAKDCLRIDLAASFVRTGTASDLSPPERTVLALARTRPIRWRAIQHALLPYAVEIERALIGCGALLAPADIARLRRRRAFPYLLLLLFGATKWVVGTMRDRPVGYLTALMILTVVIAALQWWMVNRTTARGAAVLDEAQKRTTRLRRAPTAPEADMAVALFGTAVLAGSGWADLHQLRIARLNDGGSSGASDGGGCGGGGCGGGGCGGCGGG